MKPQLIILSGIPNSGKTTYRYFLEHLYQTFGKPYTVICRDDIREEGWGKKYTYTTQNEHMVTNIVDGRFKTASELKHNIIIDATHCKESYLNEWIKRKPEGYDLKIVFFPINFYIASLRNILRWIKIGKWIPWKVMRDMDRNFNKLDKSKYEKYNLQG